MTRAGQDGADRPGAPPLSHLYFYLTEGCNLACRHCWIAPRFDPEGRLPMLPLSLAERAIDEARPLGLAGVKLSGGEPLLCPDFEAIVALVGRHGLRLTIETNGVLCTTAAARVIAGVEQRHVSVSLDGVDAATHDEIRGVPGAFDGACRGVGELVAAGVAPQIIFTVMRANMHQIEDIARLGETLGASSVKINLLQPTGRGERAHGRDEALGIEELVALGQRVERELAPETSVPLLYHWPAAFRSLSRLADGDAGECGVLSILGVLASGEYALCGIGKHEPALVYGRVGEDPLDRLWREHPTLRELRRKVPAELEGVCARCLMRHRCLGACLAQNFYRTGSLWSPYWFCERAEAAGCFPETRLIPSKDTVE